MNYEDQLMTESWFKLTEAVRARDQRVCRNCEVGHRLEVHHVFYIRGRKAWEYPLEAFMTFCRDHHRAAHDKPTPVFQDDGDITYGPNAVVIDIIPPRGRGQRFEICIKCDGVGILPQYDHIEAGMCFACHGEGVTTSK